MKNIFIFSILLFVSCTSLKQTKVSINREIPDEEFKEYRPTIEEFKIVFFVAFRNGRRGNPQRQYRMDKSIL